MLEEMHADCTVVCQQRELSQRFIDELLALLFPPFSSSHESRSVKERWLCAQQILRRAILTSGVSEVESAKVIESFFTELPEMRANLVLDAKATLATDPAANTIEEVVVAYPGFYATAVYRFAHVIYSFGHKVFARLMTEYAHSKTGIDIHPRATIGRHFVIDHGTGVVIGETAAIGDHVKIYQGVTLGALSVAKEKAGIKRHPTIEHDVVIYAGATILGGDTVVGTGSIIGGNAWITSSVPPNSIVLRDSVIKKREPENNEALVSHGAYI